jgi:hypothetical protein
LLRQVGPSAGLGDPLADATLHNLFHARIVHIERGSVKDDEQ